jgi:sugar phosphate isomerase/epimerase
MSTHVGFVQPKNRSAYHVIVQRVREVADLLHDYGCELLMETGQERAVDLVNFIGDLNRSNVGVNFDPANMVLYGAGDPIGAIGIIGKHIKHVHVKDAIASDSPRQTWGREVPFGRGQVEAGAFVRGLNEVGYKGPLVIEREGGNARVADVAAAVEVLKTALA